jgi:hypothetical protein
MTPNPIGISDIVASVDTHHSSVITSHNLRSSSFTSTFTFLQQNYVKSSLPALRRHQHSPSSSLFSFLPRDQPFLRRFLDFPSPPDSFTAMSQPSPSTASSLPFPHPILTPIVSEPTNPTIQLLQQELYANARAIHSTRGGGANGHLAIVMSDADYVARAGVPFIIPIHPGAAPVHALGATAPQITETNRQYAADLAEHTHYLTVVEELKRQILQAVLPRYFRILADPDFGYADVSVETLLTHLRTTYGAITLEDLEANRARLTADWDPDSPLEDVWTLIRETQRFAADGHDPISDLTVLSLLLTVFEKTGVFSTAVDKWRDKDPADWTLANLQSHFTKANIERKRKSKLTAQTGGFHTANAAAGTQPFPPSPSPAPSSFRGPTGIAWYYCHTHGLGRNKDHTSISCLNKGPEHNDAATLDNMLGGNNKILIYTRGAQRGPRRNIPASPGP